MIIKRFWPIGVLRCHSATPPFSYILSSQSLCLCYVQFCYTNADWLSYLDVIECSILYILKLLNIYYVIASRSIYNCLSDFFFTRWPRPIPLSPSLSPLPKVRIEASYSLLSFITLSRSRERALVLLPRLPRPPRPPQPPRPRVGVCGAVSSLVEGLREL